MSNFSFMVCDLEEYARGCLVVFTCRSVQTSLRCVDTYIPTKVVCLPLNLKEKKEKRRRRRKKRRTRTIHVRGEHGAHSVIHVKAMRHPAPPRGQLRSATLGEPPSAALQQTPDQHTDNSDLWTCERLLSDFARSEEVFVAAWKSAAADSPVRARPMV